MTDRFGAIAVGVGFAASSVALLLAAFEPWTSGDGTHNGPYDEITATLAAVAALGAIAYFVTKARPLVLIPVAAGAISVGVLVPAVPDPLGPFGGPGPNIHLTWAVWLAIAGAFGVLIASAVLFVDAVVEPRALFRSGAVKRAEKGLVGDATGDSDSRSGSKLKSLAGQVRTARRLGDFDTALRAAEEFVARFPDEVKAHREFALVAEDMGDHQLIVSHAKELIRLGDGTPRTRLRLARALSQLGKLEEAVSAMRPAARSGTADARFLASYGKFARAAGLLDESIGALQRSLELDPGNRGSWSRLIATFEDVGRKDEAGAARASLEALPEQLTLATVVERLRNAAPSADDDFVIDIGCRDGRASDPCFALYQQGFPGIAVDAGYYPKLFANLPQPQVRKLLNTFVTPGNVVELLNRNGSPQRPTVLKIDIDSFDGYVLKSALEALRPLAIHMEVNPEIPPPIRYAVHYHPRTRDSCIAGFYGCSIAFATDVGRDHGYDLLDYNGHDVTLIPNEHLHVFGIDQPVDIRARYLREPSRICRFHRVGYNAAAWRERTDYDNLLPEIWDACLAASIKQNKTRVPFLLSR
jgi:tetratricopeptide (TPR) repeat protein